jgi:hypothetical protein
MKLLSLAIFAVAALGCEPSAVTRTYRADAAFTGIGHGVGPTITDFVASGPVTAISGQTISGLWISNPNGPCITVNGVSNVTILNNQIGPCGPTAAGVGIDLYSSDHVTVENNALNDVATGLEASDSTGGTITFSHNLVTKVRGPYPRGQMVQFNTVSGAGSSITCNVSDQAIGGYLDGSGAYTGPEDHINLYMSNGTATSPIEVAYNKLRGGGSKSGGGTVLGDSAGSNEYSHDNIMINTGQYGAGIAGGTGMRLADNRVFASQNPWTTGAGIEVEAFGTVACANPAVSGNRVNYTQSSGGIYGYWSDGKCSGISLTANVFSDPTVTADMWNDVLPQCQ